MLTLKNILRTIDKISIILATSLYYGSAAIAQSAPTSPASTPGKLTIVNLDSTKNQTQIQRESRQHILAAQTGGGLQYLYILPQAINLDLLLLRIDQPAQAHQADSEVVIGEI